MSPGCSLAKPSVEYAAGNNHALVLTSDGKLFAWGQNNRGQFGDGTAVNAPLPVAVNMTGVLAGKTVKAIAGCMDSSAVLTEDGKVYTWGNNSNGQLGVGSNIDSLLPVAVVSGGSLAGKVVDQIACGFNHMLALTRDGQIFAWGLNTSYQLGNNTITSTTVPTAVTMTALAGKTVTKIVSHNSHSFALTQDGWLYGWGYNNYGQIGNGTGVNVQIPTLVPRTGALAGKTLTDVSVGMQHSLALSSDGQVFAWGWNNNGQLGVNSTTSSTLPLLVTGFGALDGKVATAIGATWYQSQALTSEGKVVSWGMNEQGQLATGDYVTAWIPVESNLPGGKDFLQTEHRAGRADHSCSPTPEKPTPQDTTSGARLATAPSTTSSPPPPSPVRLLTAQNHRRRLWRGRRCGQRRGPHHGRHPLHVGRQRERPAWHRRPSQRNLCTDLRSHFHRRERCAGGKTGPLRCIGQQPHAGAYR
jgi:alpha-tubulin suppressor-like RCC1 family protein